MNDQPTPPPVKITRRFEVDWPFLIVASLSLSSAAVVFVRDGWDVFVRIFEEDLALFAGVLPKVLLGTLIGAFARVLIKREQMVRLVGEGSGLRGLAIAAAAGAIFPGGPFTIFPLVAGFLLGGADRGAAVAFVSSWLLIGVNRAIVWELPFFGADVVALRIAASLPLPIVMGALARLAAFARFDRAM